MRAGVLDDVPKDQFAFPAGVACIDYLQCILVPDQLAKDVGTTGHFVGRLELEFDRHDGQLFHVPFVLCFHGRRHRQFKQVTDRPRDQVFFVLVVVFPFLKAAQRLGDVASDRRLFRNYEGLGHGAGIEPS